MSMIIVNTDLVSSALTESEYQIFLILYAKIDAKINQDAIDTFRKYADDFSFIHPPLSEASRTKLFRHFTIPSIIASKFTEIEFKKYGSQNDIPEIDIFKVVRHLKNMKVEFIPF